MWIQSLDPLNSPILSAVVAAIPILVFLLCLVVLKLTGLRAAAVALITEIVIALLVFRMPLQSVAGAGLLGFLNAIWPIAYIIVIAVWLYKLAVASGRFDVIRSSVASVSADQRLQVLLISFSFGAFLEGVAGFGVPIAICAAMLVQLGFRPVKAAMVSLVANFAAGAYGAIGIPVIVGAQVGGMDVMDLSRDLVIILQPLTFLIPFLLVVILDGWRGLRETLPATVTLTIVFSGSQAGILLLLGPELAAIVPGLLGMLTLAALGRFWKPTRIFRVDGTEAPVMKRHTPREVIAAWSPFYILTGFVLLWSAPFFKALFAPDGALAGLVATVPIPGVTGAITTATGTVVANSYSWTPVNATGTALLLAVLVTFLTTPAIKASMLVDQLKVTLKELWRALVLIAAILVLANIANLSGGSATIGSALAAAGPLFPLLAPVIGWVGVFLTGSVVNNNTLFGQLQATTANGIGVDPTLLVAANTAGGTAAKVISPQSIAIAAGAVGLSGRESEILRAAIPYSLGLLALISVWTFTLSIVGAA
jgi:lactate permease